MSLGSAQGKAEGADRLTVFELVQRSLKCERISALFSARGVRCQSRKKAALAEAAAVSLKVADDRAFLPDEGGVRTGAAAAAKKRPRDAMIQTVLSVVKEARTQIPPPVEGVSGAS